MSTVVDYNGDSSNGWGHVVVTTAFSFGVLVYVGHRACEVAIPALGQLDFPLIPVHETS